MESPYVLSEAVATDDFPSVQNFSATLPSLSENTSCFSGETTSLVDFDKCDEDNPLFNCTLEEYLGYYLGPQRLSLTVAIPITVLYVLIFVTGVVGNVSVCIVIVKNMSMHTATNYYLFSLAISDLTLLLLGLPNDISVYWHQYPYSLGIGFCKMRALLSEASSYVSVLTIVAFSMERYLAICHPLHLYTMSGLQRAVRIIAALWVVSILCAIPFALQTTIHYLDYPPNSNNKTMESAFCAMLTPPDGWPVWELSSIVFFLLPAAIMLVLYCRMGLKIRARSRNHLGKGVKGSVHGETRQVQSRKAIIRMLAAVVIAFFVCWAPFHAQRLIYLYGQEWTHFKNINEWMFSITGWLYYVSSTVNPILYNVMSNRYRVAFRETLCCGRRNRNNGFGLSRDQSSFRETTIAASGEGSHLVRVRSVSIEPLSRSGITNSRLSRHSTLSGALSKDYSNLNHGPKSKRSSHDSGTKIKPPPSTKLFDLSPEREGYESGTLLEDHNSIPNSDDIYKILSNNSQGNTKRSCFKLDAPRIEKHVHMQDPMLLIGKASSNGIKKLYQPNVNNLPFTNNVMKEENSESREDEIVNLKQNDDELETCI